jgi:hypothetical protein
MASRCRTCFTLLTLLATSCGPSTEREPSDAGTTYADHSDAVATTDYRDGTTETATDIADASAMMDVDSSRPPLPDVMSTDSSTSTRDADVMSTDASTPTPDADVVTVRVVTHTYQTDGAALDNPERGWYSRRDIVMDRDFTTAARIVHSYVRLDSYKAGTDIGATDPIATGMQAGLQRLREQGRKTILRFAYNYGDWTGSGCSNADATEATITKHLTQLRPLVQPYRDIVMGLEAGFIGCWGEWHSSWYQGDQEIPPKTAIVRGLVGAFTWPHDTALDPDPAWQNLLYAPQIAIRYPSLVRAVGTQLTQAEQARVGHHNDCFLASNDDSGTWGRGPQPLSIADDKAYVSTLGRNHIVGGETCAYPGRVTCSTALAELAAMHFTYLNIDFHREAVQAFKSGGCFDEISRRLGYRLWIKTADFPDIATAGSTFQFRFVVQNDGFAAPLYDRPIYVVFDAGSGQPRKVALPGAAPTSWQPGETAISVPFTIPSDLTPGQYRFALWLPDKTVDLQARAEYAIRFANVATGTFSWDAIKGYNVLQPAFRVSQ